MLLVVVVVVVVTAFVVVLEEVGIGIEDRETVGRPREDESGRLTGRMVKFSFLGEEGLQMAVTGETTSCSGNCFASAAIL